MRLKTDVSSENFSRGWLLSLARINNAVMNE